MGCITLGKSLKVIDSARGYPNGKTQLLPLNPLKIFIYWLWSKQSGKYWPLKLKKKQLQMFYHNKWNLFRQTFRQGGTMFDCFSWARKNATRESIMGSKYFWNFIILLYFFGSIEKNNNIRTMQSESFTFASLSFPKTPDYSAI